MRFSRGRNRLAKNRNYPLYETTVFEDFRIMTENVANKYPGRIAISYKKNPKDEKTVKITYTEMREYIRGMGTELISMGCRDKHVGLVGESSYDWVSSYFGLMSIGAVVVPIDKDLPTEEIASILKTAECEYIFYSETIECKIEELKASVPNLKIFICMGEPKWKVHSSFPTLLPKAANVLKMGDNLILRLQIDTERMATIVFTSGTTGARGVMLPRKYSIRLTQGMYLFNITRKTLMVLPPHHTLARR